MNDTLPLGWVAADWGTSHLRLWLMDANDQPIHRIDADCGMSGLDRDAFEPALLRLLTPYLTEASLTVICCGMAGSRQGWIEAPYAAAPCAPPTAVTAAVAPVRDPRLKVFVLPGVKQDQPADVMRGEETQIAGVLQTKPGFDGVICLPGTHSKWARVSDGAIRDFRTCMTGELFALLSQHSVLHHSLASDGWDDQAFAHGLEAGGEDWPLHLFSIRADALLHDADPVQARARLSGLLIGSELAAARPHWQDRAIVIVGEDGLARAYATALRRLGATPECLNAETVTLAGLTAAYATLSEDRP